MHCLQHAGNWPYRGAVFQTVPWAGLHIFKILEGKKKKMPISPLQLRGYKILENTQPFACDCRDLQRPRKCCLTLCVLNIPRLITDPTGQVRTHHGWDVPDVCLNINAHFWCLQQSNYCNTEVGGQNCLIYYLTTKELLATVWSIEQKTYNDLYHFIHRVQALFWI